MLWSTTSKTAQIPRPRTDIALLCELGVLESSMVVCLLCLYKKSDNSSAQFLYRPAGWIFVLSVILIVFCAELILHAYERDRRSKSKDFRLTVVLNLVTLVLLSLTGEIFIRSLAVSSVEGTAVRGHLLTPQLFSWKALAAENVRKIQDVAPNGTWNTSYLVPDDLLGWTVGRSRRSADGLYFSSEEGLRSPIQGARLDDAHGKRRIALVGDSFTFGLEVGYQESWAHHLETKLGPDYQVLNFGVDGFGIDQAYLRYQRDVKPWHPDLVILSVVSHDFLRTLSVYPPITFRWKLPFSKPRFVLRGEDLTLINVPVKTPDQIFRSNDIANLPFLEYEPGYDSSEWEWHYYHSSYLVRFLLSIFPSWSPPGNQRVTHNTEFRDLNSAVLKSFIREADVDATNLAIVYLPSSRTEFVTSSGDARLARAILKGSTGDYSDFTSCVSAVNPTERYLKFHYTAAANAAVGECMERLVRSRLP